MPGVFCMPGMGERAYAYSKSCGIIGKSFLGKRLRGLEKVTRLSELDRMVFPMSSRDLPEKELLHDLEKRITGRAVNSIISIVESFSRVPEFLVLLLRSYEYADLKSAVIASLEREKSAPFHTDLGVFQKVHFDAWPDIGAMVEGTEFVFLLDKKVINIEKQDLVDIQTLLDRHYYNALWKSLFSLPPGDRRAAARILSDEISLRNSSWVLRLRTYYGMKPEEVMPHLINISAKVKGSLNEKSVSRSLADEALQCLEYPLDNLSAFSSWRWNEFLNSDSGVGHWHADPRHFQNAASQYLYRLARHYFRLKPFSLDTIFCFIKLKQFEEDILISSAEGLGMSMSSRDIFSLMGVES